jgi:hypothetical protein
MPRNKIDTFNKFAVTGTVNMNGAVAVYNPPQPREVLSNADALVLAAYLVAIADPSGEIFALVLDAVKNS